MATLTTEQSTPTFDWKRWPETESVVDSMIDDALADLEKMGLLEKTAGGFRVLPLRPAVDLLENAWKSYFHRAFRTPDPWAAIREQQSPVLDYTV